GPGVPPPPPARGRPSVAPWISASCLDAPGSRGHARAGAAGGAAPSRRLRRQGGPADPSNLIRVIPAEGSAMTQLESARRGIVTPEMRRVAQGEAAPPEFIRDEVARGRVVIPANVRHLAGSGGQAPLDRDGREGVSPESSPGLWVNQTVAQRQASLERLDAGADELRGERAPRRLDPTGIGRTITTKINANIGASPVSSSVAEEVEKLRWAQRYGADTLMDLSTGGDLAACRQAVLDHATIPIGTVPIYSMIIGRRIEELSPDVILREIERQAQQGVDYFTIHAGVLREHLPLIGPRICGIVSRGGSLLAKWMIHHGRQ